MKVAIGLGMAGFVLAPWPEVKFLCLVPHVWMTCVSTARWADFRAIVFTSAFAAAFLLNPMWLLWARHTGLPAHLVAAALAGLGAAWLACGRGSAAPGRVGRLVSSPLHVGVWAVILLLVFRASWHSDLAYGGDENYHFTTAQMARLLFSNTLLWLPVTLLLGGGLFLRTGRSAGWGLLLLALAVPFLVPPELLDNPDLSARIVRYPAAQAWISGGLSAFCAESWDTFSFVSGPVARMLPMAALLLLGLMPRRSWISLAAVATVPNLLYHGTILYLEIPLVVLACLVLADGRHVLADDPDQLRARWSWPALVLLGFTKETALPLLLATVGLRLLWRRRLRGEATVIAAVLGPALLYLALRAPFGGRQYVPQPAHWIDPALWAASLRGLLLQAGPILVAALIGAVVLAWRRRWADLALAVVLAAAAQAFLLADRHVETIGTARFQLLLLPPILVLAWAGMRGWLGMLLAGAIVAANLWMSPVELTTGRRADFSGVGERWYPFRACFEEIRRLDPNARLLLGNMTSEYGAAIVTAQMRWEPGELAQDSRPGLAEALREGRARGFSFVVYRYDGVAPAPPPEAEGFVFVSTFEGRTGGLLLWRYPPP